MSAKKWFPTPEIDRQIVRIYTEEYDRKRRRLPTSKAFAARIGWPGWAVKKRAAQLGVAMTKEKPWSEAELELLIKSSHLVSNYIVYKFKKAGYTRSLNAIVLKRKRMGYKPEGYYSANSAAQAFGTDAHAITRWIRLGWLKASLRGTARLPQQGGDAWLIKESAIYSFIIEHPNEFRLRCVDQRWFLYIITKGKVAA